MAGMKGFEHRCVEEKVSKSANKKSLKDSPFSYAQIDMIWDFYVTHAINSGTGLERTVEDYGWKKTASKETGYPALEKALAQSAGIDVFCIIRAKTIKDTLSAMDLSEDRICVSHPRAVLMQNFQLEINENEEMSFGASQESRVNAIFRHIRNSLAHGNTYFFENGNVLLEDKDGTKPTARILLTQKTLLDWIKVIDFNEQFYRLIDVCKSCPQGEK